ncbi:MAG: response regulator, partial [Bacteroidota bacterium]|nr:response regulator [Bacteroidota bacterium]
MNKILIVDDSVDLLEPVKFYLELPNYGVKTLANAVAIEAEIQKYNPDVLILDMLLRGEDGREICKNLRKNSETRYLPILLFSASPWMSTTSKTNLCDDYLEKPFDLKILLMKIKSLLAWGPIRR